MSSVLETASKNVVATMGQRTQRAFDVGIIMVIADIITQILERCQNKAPAQLKDSADKPSFLERLAVRRHVRQNLSPQEFRAFGDDVCESLIENGSKLSSDDWNKLVAEARNS